MHTLAHLLPAVLCSTLVLAQDDDATTKAAREGIHLPIYRRPSAKRLARRGTETGAIGLGDFEDVTYNVMVTVGSITTPVVLDTGSSDLWVESTACDTNCTPNVPLYPTGSFVPTGLDVRLLYGDSYTGTHASGPIGRDTVGIAGLNMQGQYFAAINNTNTTVFETGSAGIFGLSFPVNSVIWNQVQSTSSTGASKRSTHPSHHARSHGGANLGIRTFPDLTSSALLASSQTAASFLTSGPLLARLALSSSLPQPMFAVSIQRDTIELGGNIGQLSIGALPPAVENSSLTWAPVRGYTVEQGGLQPPSDAPDEVYPIGWEIPIDDVYLDGTKLARSSLSNISVSALLDTGNSLIRGPEDVVSAILSGISASYPGNTIPCSAAHNLSFSIGGQLFPVDPRDFISQAYVNETSHCVPNIAPTDPPTDGFLYSWSLGDPFLKGVLAAFYFGNLTLPSRDPARIGLLSTVPSNAADYLEGVLSALPTTGTNFPALSEGAPTGTLTPASTVDGVGQASQSLTLSAPAKTQVAGPLKHSSAAGPFRLSTPTITMDLALLLVALCTGILGSWTLRL